MIQITAYFWTALVVFVLAAAGLQYILRKGGTALNFTPDFKVFQTNYLLIYLLVMCADWLQGPYVYALYDSYGFTRDDIAAFFIVGFGSSMIFGTFIGSLADTYGRKKMSVVFGIFYSLSCLTKLSRSYTILMIGRLLAGISTSLLFSVFESWMIYEHHRRLFSEEWLTQTFSTSIFGNGIIAILAGFMASGVARSFGFVAPFMLALVILVVASLLVLRTWTENYGDSKIDVQDSLMKGVNALKKDVRILLLGGIQSLFEASMYVFVFMWTPTLAQDAEEFKEENSPIHGLIFSGFMVAIMVGSSAFGLLIRKYTPEKIQQYMLLCAAGCLLVPALLSSAVPVFISFMLFEICCGVYFPTQGTLRSIYIPEESRATIMNFFRVPLNLLVVLVLKWSSLFSNSTIFFICAIWLAVAAGLQYLLNQHKRPGSNNQTTSQESSMIVEQQPNEEQLEFN